MRAWLFDGPGLPLRLAEVETPSPGPGELLIRVTSCAVCRTDLHVLDGELIVPDPPRILGHQITGLVVRAGAAARHAVGARVGVPWLGWTCGACEACRAGRENLCDAARFTGLHRDGGFAEMCVADGRYAFPLPQGLSDAQAAPLLCGGLIGYRALRLAGDALRPGGDGPRLGVYGFGAAALLVTQVAVWRGARVFAFTRPGDLERQAFALRSGAAWAGDSTAPPPEPLDAAILFAPTGELVPLALAAVRKGGVVVCGEIHMSDIPSFPYALLWGERVVRSVANLTRADGEELLALAPRVPIRTTVTELPFERLPEAIAAVRAGRVEGAAVVVV